MSEKETKYCSLCGRPDADQSWCKHCRSSYKKARRRANHMAFSKETKLKISIDNINYTYKEGLEYTWRAGWYNKSGILTFISKIKDQSDYPESVKELNKYKITEHYKTPPS